jgi:arylsulfatase A-like enzyme
VLHHERNADEQPFAEEDVYRVEAGLGELHLLDVDDEVAGDEVGVVGQHDVYRDVHRWHHVLAVGVHEAEPHRMLTLVLGHEGDAQRDGALGMHGGQLRRHDGIERTQQVEFPAVIRRRVTEDSHLSIHRCSVESIGKPPAGQRPNPRWWTAAVRALPHCPDAGAGADCAPMSLRRLVRLLCPVFGLLAGGLALLAQDPSGAPYITSHTTNPPAARRPCMILILADDLGWGDLGCYGQTRIKTPNLDRLAAEGMRFTQFYAGSTVCTPSRAALMLGRHTGRLHLRGNVTGGSLLAEEYTFAQMLQAGGYHTGLIGKWGLADVGLPGVPQHKGFDEFVGYLNNQHAHDYYPPTLFRHDGGSGFDGVIQLAKNQAGRRGDYGPEVCTKAALNFIRINQPTAQNQRQPFFLALNYTTPHANNELGRLTGNGMQVPDDAPYSTETWPAPERNKAAMITRLDADVGRLVEQLKKQRLADNTLLLFTSDNGPHSEGGVKSAFHRSAGPFRGQKRDLTEGGIRVPLIAWWPGRVPAGVVSTQMWAFWDVFPTLAELARLTPPKDLDGISMAPTLLGHAQTNQPGHLYWEFHEGGFQQAVRLGDWKGIRNGTNAPLALYDLKTDPRETNDVAEAHSEVTRRIEELMLRSRTEHTNWPAKPAPPRKAAPAAKPAK